MVPEPMCGSSMTLDSFFSFGLIAGSFSNTSRPAPASSPFSSIRAIETRRDVVRSANTGISCFVDRKGVIHSPTAWWVSTAERRTVYLHDELTFFVRHGDLIGRAAVVLALLILPALLVLRIRRKRAAAER